eukprot:6456345-Amphidinium_carterae.2
MSCCTFPRQALDAAPHAVADIDTLLPEFLSLADALADVQNVLIHDRLTVNARESDNSCPFAPAFLCMSGLRCFREAGSLPWTHCVALKAARHALSYDMMLRRVFYVSVWRQFIPRSSVLQSSFCWQKDHPKAPWAPLTQEDEESDQERGSRQQQQQEASSSSGAPIFVPSDEALASVCSKVETALAIAVVCTYCRTLTWRKTCLARTTSRYETQESRPG